MLFGVAVLIGLAVEIVVVDDIAVLGRKVEMKVGGLDGEGTVAQIDGKYVENRVGRRLGT